MRFPWCAVSPSPSPPYWFLHHSPPPSSPSLLCACLSPQKRPDCWRLACAGIAGVATPLSDSSALGRHQNCPPPPTGDGCHGDEHYRLSQGAWYLMLQSSLRWPLCSFVSWFYYCCLVPQNSPRTVHCSCCSLVLRLLQDGSDGLSRRHSGRRCRSNRTACGARSSARVDSLLPLRLCRRQLRRRRATRSASPCTRGNSGCEILGRPSSTATCADGRNRGNRRARRDSAGRNGHRSQPLTRRRLQPLCSRLACPERAGRGRTRASRWRRSTVRRSSRRRRPSCCGGASRTLGCWGALTCGACERRQPPRPRGRSGCGASTAGWPSGRAPASSGCARRPCPRARPLADCLTNCQKDHLVKRPMLNPVIDRLIEQAVDFLSERAMDYATSVVIHRGADGATGFLHSQQEHHVFCCPATVSWRRPSFGFGPLAIHRLLCSLRAMLPAGHAHSLCPRHPQPLSAGSHLLPFAHQHGNNSADYSRRLPTALDAFPARTTSVPWTQSTAHSAGPHTAVHSPWTRPRQDLCRRRYTTIGRRLHIGPPWPRKACVHDSPPGTSRHACLPVAVALRRCMPVRTDRDGRISRCTASSSQLEDVPYLTADLSCFFDQGTQKYFRQTIARL